MASQDKIHYVSLHTEDVSPTESKHILSYSNNNNKEERKPKYGGGWVGVFLSPCMLPFFKNTTVHFMAVDKTKTQLLQLLPCISDHKRNSLPLPQWQTIWQCSYDLVSSILQTLASEHPQDEGNLYC